MRAVIWVKKLTNSVWSRATSIRQGIERDPRANERPKRGMHAFVEVSRIEH